MRITQEQYKRLLAYIGWGDLAEADVIIFGNEEGTGGSSVRNNIIARCDYFGRNKEGQYSECVDNNIGPDSGYWQKFSQQGRGIVRSIGDREDVGEKSNSKSSAFLLTIARMMLALEHQDVGTKIWFQNLNDDEVSKQIRETRENGLFTGYEKGIKCGLMDWRPLPRPDEKCTKEKWPVEYQNISNEKYLKAFTFNKAKELKDDFSDYVQDVEKRKQIINNFFKAYPKKVVIGFGDIETKKKIFEGIFVDCQFEMLEILNNEKRCLHGIVKQKGGELNIFLLPFPLSGQNGFREGRLLPFYEEFTEQYLMPIINDMSNVHKESVCSNDYINNGKWYTDKEKERLEQIANTIETKEEMYQKAPEIALEFRRTEIAICKRIETLKGWFWAKK